MKKVTIIMILAIFFSAFVLKGYAGDGKMPKVYQEMQDQAEKMKKKGALAVIGVAVSDAGRIDVGKRKAIEKAKQEIAEQRKVYVETSTHDFMEEVGVGKNNEMNDLFSQMIETVAVTIVNGASVSDFNYFVTKDNKKDGTATYIVLYVITPDAMQKALEDELQKKGSKENLYQRYMDSKAKEAHDKKVQEYKTEFESK
jgi:hypothetical protein